MNLLFIIPSLAQGGQEKAGMILTNYLKNYHNVTVITFEGKHDLDFDYKSSIIRLEIPRSANIVGKFWVVIKRIIAVRRIIKKREIETSISFGETAMWVNALTLTNETKIHSLRTSLEDIGDGYLKRKLLKIIFRRFHKVVPVSIIINKQLKHLFGISNELFAYNGYDLEKINQDKKRLFKNSANVSEFPVLSHLGRFSRFKGHKHLVRVFTEIRKSIPDAKLLLIGGVSSSEDDNILNSCLIYLRENGLRTKRITENQTLDWRAADVILLGHVQNPFSYLSQSVLFVYPSIVEGFPNALVEAMACGVPVVSADCQTGPEEILGQNEFGRLLPVFNDKADFTDALYKENRQIWVNEIIRLIKNKEELAHYKSKSIERSKDFSIEVSCKKWLDIIENKNPENSLK